MFSLENDGGQYYSGVENTIEMIKGLILCKNKKLKSASYFMRLYRLAGKPMLDLPLRFTSQETKLTFQAESLHGLWAKQDTTFSKHMDPILHLLRNGGGKMGWNL